MALVFADFHHGDLYRALQFLFEKRFGWPLYRPLGREYYDRGYFWHPREDEVIGVLTEQCPFDPAKHKDVFDAPNKNGVEFRNADPDGMLFRWLPLDRIHEIDLIVCTQERNEDQFYRLRRDFGLKCPIVRYTGNGGELVDINKFDIFLPALLEHYERFVATGQKPGILYSPEFDINNGLFCYTEIPKMEKQIVRTLLNFQYHHREPGSPYECWMRYCGYCDEIGALHLMHGLGTPPPGVEVDLDVIIDISFRKMGLDHLLDRSTWPDLRYNRGEPPNHRVIADLIKHSNAIHHSKHVPPEGYGFLLRYAAACGRPLFLPTWYQNLSASRFLEDRKTCIWITGLDPIDKENFKWALQPDNNARMGAEIRRRFDQHVNFDSEAEAIRKLL